MRTSTRMIALACAAVSGPLLASAAIGIRDYVSSSSEPDDDGFSLDGDGVFVSPANTIIVTGERPPSGPPSGGFPWDWGDPWGGGGCDSSSCGGGGGDAPPQFVAECARGDGDVRMTFDGRTIRVTAGYSYSGQDLASVATYVAGIEENWTVDFPTEGIGIEVDLVPDPDGFVITLDFNYHGREGLQPNQGGNWEMRLGPLADFQDLLPFKKRVAAHEFGHFWFGRNRPLTSGNPSIMSDPSQGSVLPADLRAMVLACQQGNYVLP